MFEPWIGSNYSENRVKPLVIGESRYDEEYTDRRIITARIAGEFRGGQRRTYTNFERAVLGQNCSDDDAQTFWHSVIFHNYNVNAFPGGPRVRLTRQQREDPENIRTLRRMVQDHRPTHAIVWGLTNWEYVELEAGQRWIDSIIPETVEPCCTATVDGHSTLFTRIAHPSSGFSSKRWATALTNFLALQP